MELALPHIVLRVCGPGVGPDLVAALSVHPVEVSEARDVSEMHRVGDERTAILVVLVDPPDAQRFVSETWQDFPGVPILVISDSTQPFVPSETARRGWVDTVTSSQSLQDICWLVLEAVSRAAHAPGLVEHPLGPHRIDVDGKGVVLTAALTPDVAITSVLHLHAGDSLLSILEPSERDTIAAAIERARAGAAQFCTSRMLDERGRPHAMTLGIRDSGDGRIAILVQPLIAGGPIIGRHINNRDPITGLLTRWAMSRRLVASREPESSAEDSALIFVVLDDFEAISHYIGHRQTDDVLLQVALALTVIVPHPSLTSRLMGDTFLACARQVKHADAMHLAARLLQRIGDIEVPGFAPRFPLRASIGVACVPDTDYDLAMRVAEAAAGEARAAGGNRVVDAGSGQFTGDQARQLTACMDLGAWEVWLQPVVGPGDGRATYHEALARFDGLRRTMGSRADFFIAGQANGLLERFDRMMLQRALEIIGSHPDVRLSVNVSHETFESETFPASFLELIQRVPDGCGRIILEIASRCVALPEKVVRPRLEALAAAGLAVAIDDFGSGICRLRYLTQYPLRIVKLDQLVTGYVDDDPLQREFVRAVVSICRARGITTVAEYTRSDEQLTRLVEDGVDLFQGELFGMPRPAADVLAACAGRQLVEAGGGSQRS